MYYTYSDYLKNKYHEKVYKLPVNLPVTCPNRLNGACGCDFQMCIRDSVRAAFKDTLLECMKAVRSMLDRTPPEIRKAIYQNGIYLTGGIAKDVYKRQEYAWY